MIRFSYCINTSGLLHWKDNLMISDNLLVVKTLNGGLQAQPSLLLLDLLHRWQQFDLLNNFFKRDIFHFFFFLPWQFASGNTFGVVVNPPEHLFDISATRPAFVRARFKFWAPLSRTHHTCHSCGRRCVDQRYLICRHDPGKRQQ